MAIIYLRIIWYPFLYKISDVFVSFYLHITPHVATTREKMSIFQGQVADPREKYAFLGLYTEGRERPQEYEWRT